MAANDKTQMDVSHNSCIHHVRKRCHYIFASNFAKCWPISKVLSPTDLALNTQESDNKIPHQVSNASLHYLVKY